MFDVWYRTLLDVWTVMFLIVFVLCFLFSFCILCSMFLFLFNVEHLSFIFHVCFVCLMFLFCCTKYVRWWTVGVFPDACKKHEHPTKQQQHDNMLCKSFQAWSTLVITSKLHVSDQKTVFGNVAFFRMRPTDSQKKTKNTCQSLGHFYGNFSRPLHFKLESGCASFCYVLKTCRFVWVSSLGRPSIGGVGTVSSLTSWKRLWNYFFPYFLHKIGSKCRTQTWWKMLSTWEMHLFWAICLTRTLASIQRVHGHQWIVGSCARLHFLMRRTYEHV